MAEKHYLFAGGCPRSGTTILARVLNCHRRIDLGVERFMRHWAHETLTPDLFAADRYWTITEADTSRWKGMEKQAATLRDGYEDATFVGDKYPNLWKHYDLIFDRFPGARVIYILRNPFSVASSYQTRHDDAEDSFHFDAQRGVQDWNRSLRATLDALGKGRAITVVPYEDVFASAETVGALYAHLGLDPAEVDGPRLEHLLSEFAKNARDLRDKHDHVAKLVSLNAKYNLYRTLLNDHSLFRDTGAGSSTSEEMVHA